MASLRHTHPLGAASGLHGHSTQPRTRGHSPRPSTLSTACTVRGGPPRITTQHSLPPSSSYELKRSSPANGHRDRGGSISSTGRRDLQSQVVRAVTSSTSPGTTNNNALASGVDSAQAEGIARAKARLMQAVGSAKRGAQTDEEQRAIIEEAQVNLECLGGGTSSLDSEGALDRLHGLWRLQYSNASDVLGILRLPDLATPPFLPFPLLQVGDIYQNFVCRGQSSLGVIQNIVDWSIPAFLQENKGARFVVTADFTVRSSSSLQLIFREAAVDTVRLNELAQALLAPAVLPRMQQSMEALQFIQGFQASVPLQGSANGTSGTRGVAGGRYILTYLDEDTLIGRATAPSGSFIFKRAE